MNSIPQKQTGLKGFGSIMRWDEMKCLISWYTQAKWTETLPSWKFQSWEQSFFGKLLHLVETWSKQNCLLKWAMSQPIEKRLEKNARVEL